MKRIITTLITFLILASLSSICPADELEIETKEDCLQTLQGKEAEIERLQQELVEKEAEIERLKNLCRKHGINTTEKEITTPKEYKEIENFVKILNYPIFGIRLGDSLTNIKRSYELIPFDSGIDYPSYTYDSKLPSVKLSGFFTFENLGVQKVGAIIVFLSDSSESNYNAVIKEIASKYQVLKEEEPMDKKHNFLVSVDGEDIFIGVALERRGMEADKDCLLLFYCYNKLRQLYDQNLIDQKGTELKKHL